MTTPHVTRLGEPLIRTSVRTCKRDLDMFLLRDANQLRQRQTIDTTASPITIAPASTALPQTDQQPTYPLTASMSETENTNPGNFANRPKEEVQAIASMGGKASHGGRGKDYGEGESDESTTSAAAETKDDGGSHPPGRNPDGTFTKGSEAAAAAGHKGGQHSHDNDDK